MQVGIGDLAIPAQAALLVTLCVVAAVLLRQVAGHLALGVGVVRLVAAVTGELRSFQAALVGEAPAVLRVAVGRVVVLLMLASHVRTSVLYEQRNGNRRAAANGLNGLNYRAGWTSAMP